MRNRELPDAETFLNAADEAFGFLRDAGFEVPDGCRVTASTHDALEFHGRHVVVHVSLDRRDACVDVAFTPGRAIRETSEFRWVGLLEHAVRRGYRGGLAEFHGDAAEPWFRGELQTYAAALKVLGPDVIADAPTIFGDASPAHEPVGGRALWHHAGHRPPRLMRGR